MRRNCKKCNVVLKRGMYCKHCYKYIRGYIGKSAETDLYKRIANAIRQSVNPIPDMTTYKKEVL